MFVVFVVYIQGIMAGLIVVVVSILGWRASPWDGITIPPRVRGDGSIALP